MNFALACFAVLFAASHGGAVHPALDSLAVFQVPLGLMLLACCVWRLRWWKGAMALATLASLASSQFLWDLGNDKSGDITLYQKNLGAWNVMHQDILDDIAKYDPDVLTFQEVSWLNQPILDALKESHPYQHKCNFGDTYSMAIVSRLPPTDVPPICSQFRGLAAQEFVTPSGTGWIVSIHLLWPWPFEQPDQIKMVLDSLSTLDGPVIAAGDFNQVPWSHAVQRVSDMTGAPNQGPSAQTFQFKHDIFKYVAQLPIDHVLAPRGSVTRHEYHDSDHRALVARVGF
ncbi:MAG: endonuclease/exonuclease/phosphatase family protein [Pseudomonadota bacterium]